MKYVICLLLLIRTAYGQADNKAGLPNSAFSTAAYKATNLTGTGTRLAVAGSNGLIQPLANGTEGYMLKIVGGVPAWAVAPTGGSTVTIANDANDRLITGLGTGNLTAEANLTFNGTQLGVAGSLAIAYPRAAISNTAATYLSANMVAGDNLELQLGQSNTLRNRASLTFNYVASQSTANSLSFSFNGTNPVLSLYATGDVEMYQLATTRTAPVTSGTVEMMVVDASGKFSRRPLGASGILSSQEHSTGTSVTVQNNIGWLVVNPSSRLASLAVTLPATPIDGQEVVITFGGSMTTGVIVDAFSLTNAVIQGDSSPSEISVGDVLRYKWKASSSRWYRIY